jgi:DNA-directed RNA polymerase subunit RPC12/RpoP
MNYHCISCKRNWNEKGIGRIPIHTDSGHETEIFQCPACGSQHTEISHEARGVTGLEEIGLLAIGVLLVAAIIAGIVFLYITFF